MFSIRATCPAHNILLDLIKRIFGKEYSSYTNNHYYTLTIPWYQIQANQPNEWPLTVIRLKLRKKQPQFTALHTIITHILNINYTFPASPSRSCDRLFSNSLLHENDRAYTSPPPTTNAMDKVKFQKLTVAKSLKKSRSFLRTSWWITVNPNARHLTVSWASLILSTCPLPALNKYNSALKRNVPIISYLHDYKNKGTVSTANTSYSHAKNSSLVP